VVNRSEVIEVVSGGIQPLEKDVKFKLEPEWVAVVLLSLVYHGDIVLNVDGREELDASSIERALTLPLNNIINFRFYKRPQTLPLNLWVMIFEGLELQPGLIRDENTRENAVTELQKKVQAELDMVVKLQSHLEQGLQLWNEPIFTDRLTYVVERGHVVDSNAPDVFFPPQIFCPACGATNIFRGIDEIQRCWKIAKLAHYPRANPRIFGISPHRSTGTSAFRCRQSNSFLRHISCRSSG
jgi:hypothetical protein